MRCEGAIGQGSDLFRQAGEQAVARSAYREAVAAFEQALEVVLHLRRATNRVHRPLICAWRCAMRSTLWESSGGFSSPCRKPKLLPKPWATNIGWVGLRLSTCPICGGMRTGPRPRDWPSRPDYCHCPGDTGLTTTAQYYLGIGYYSMGDYRRAEECFPKNIVCLHGALLHEHLGLPGLASVFSRGLLVLSLAECGAFAVGKVPAEEGVQIAEAADHPYSLVLAYWAMGRRAFRQGDLPQALPMLERAFDLVQGSHLQLLFPQASASLGAAYALVGRTAKALLMLEQAVAQAVAMRYLFEHALRVVWLGEAYLLAGRLDEASTQAQRALEFSRAHQERGHETYALRLLGAIAAQRAARRLSEN